jgi:hypothetical protein
MEQGYFQEFDTVNFDETQIVSDRKSLYQNTIVRSDIYQAFYQVVLSPNQVLDSAWLRYQLLNLQLVDWPYIFSVDQQYIRKENPFTQQLFQYFRRVGKDSFLFSSAFNSEQKKLEWSGLDIKPEIPDHELLRIARGYYGEIIEWADQLDKMFRQTNLRVIPFKNQTNFKEAATALFPAMKITFPEVPITRSGAYLTAKEIAHDQSEYEDQRRKINTTSNVQYAINVDARLVQNESNDPLTDLTKLPPDLRQSHLVINFEGLLSKFPELREAITNQGIRQRSEARAKARPSIELAWKQYLEQKFDQALENFRDGFNNYYKSLVGKTVKLNFFETKLKANHDGSVELDVEINENLPRALKYLWATKNFSKGGLDQFLNIK